MAKYNVVICCWERGHINILPMSKKKEERLAKNIPFMKDICPNCRDEHGEHQAIFIKDGQTLFGNFKSFTCEHGHITNVSLFANGQMHVKCGDEYENIKGTANDVSGMVDSGDLSCYHTVDGERCGCSLREIDDVVLETPGQQTAIKTRVRVGDIWDRNGVEPVTNGSYDGNGGYNASRSEEAHKRYVKALRRKKK